MAAVAPEVGVFFVPVTAALSTSPAMPVSLQTTTGWRYVLLRDARTYSNGGSTPPRTPDYLDYLASPGNRTLSAFFDDLEMSDTTFFDRTPSLPVFDVPDEAVYT